MLQCTPSMIKKWLCILNIENYNIFLNKIIELKIMGRHHFEIECFNRKMCFPRLIYKYYNFSANNDGILNYWAKVNFKINGTGTTECSWKVQCPQTQWGTIFKRLILDLCEWIIHSMYNISTSHRMVKMQNDHPFFVAGYGKT
jgi:hypothetical protein